MGILIRYWYVLKKTKKEVGNESDHTAKSISIVALFLYLLSLFPILVLVFVLAIMILSFHIIFGRTSR